MINKFMATNLSHDPLDWVKNLQARYRFEKLVFIILFSAITVAILALAFGISLITIIVNSEGGTLPAWFPYATIIVAAISGLLSALLGFFVVRPRYEAAHRNARYITSELLLFEAKAKDYAEASNPALLLATNVANQVKFGEGELK